MEMADVIALNKCDGDRIQQAEQSAIELQGALQLMTELKIIGSRLFCKLAPYMPRAWRICGLPRPVPASRSTQRLDG